MAFWGEGLDAASKDPKRKFRFKLEIGGLGATEGIVWYAKSVEKPAINVEAGTEHKFMGHTFKFPGSVKWEDVEATLVDPISEDASTKLLEILEKSGYVYPTADYIKDQGARQRSFHTISKGKATAALQSVVIHQLDSDGNSVEKWTLHNPFINKVAFGDLDYGSEDLSDITVGFTYDWATYNDDDTDPVFNRSIT